MKPKSYRKKTATKHARAAALQAEASAGEVVQRVLNALPELLAVAVVDARSGTSLAAHSNAANIAPATAAAFNAEVVRQKQKALTALNLIDEHIEDILISLSNQLHLMRLADGGRKFIYLAVSAHDTNLAAAREVLRVQAATL
ncbi:hypothetical protein LJ737_04810 [Hymenobacter sp. 15J16-1T3B]|uniref:hypothetical protein n=1 Tax=Hymenobacter sp. 15J16-1T3B TaxID=2886941 RepID=UPI001D0FA436|nr:hypothetical protein [Hymenobacter sp. 15J16-1T3B]MCC3156546.1 hypothetical protein [Hymenobacter sp. 15J16-1T3B]